MTRERSDRDLGAVLDAWMSEVAPTAIPVPVLEDAFARTMSTRQVRVYPWQRVAGRGGRSGGRTAFVLVAHSARRARYWRCTSIACARCRPAA